MGEISGSWLSKTRSANCGFVVDVATRLWLGARGLYSVYDARAMVDVLTLEAIACHIILGMSCVPSSNVDQIVDNTAPCGLGSVVE